MIWAPFTKQWPPALPALWVRPEKGKVSVAFFDKHFLLLCDLSYSLNTVFHRAEGLFFSFFFRLKKPFQFFHALCLWCCIYKVITEPEII